MTLLPGVATGLRANEVAPEDHVDLVVAVEHELRERARVLRVADRGIAELVGVGDVRVALDRVVPLVARGEAALDAEAKLALDAFPGQARGAAQLADVGLADDAEIVEVRHRAELPA